jgi:hypothetical protein
MRKQAATGCKKGCNDICPPLEMKDILRSMTPGENNGQAIRDELERVLSSGDFARSERVSRFLRFLVEQHLAGRGGELKESLIAVELLGRKPDYDPSRIPPFARKGCGCGRGWASTTKAKAAGIRSSSSCRRVARYCGFACVRNMLRATTKHDGLMRGSLPRWLD